MWEQFNENIWDEVTRHLCICCAYRKYKAFQLSAAEKWIEQEQNDCTPEEEENKTNELTYFYFYRRRFDLQKKIGYFEMLIFAISTHHTYADVWFVCCCCLFFHSHHMPLIIPIRYGDIKSHFFRDLLTNYSMTAT